MSRLLSVLVFLLISGCGYHLGGDSSKLPDDVSMLKIEMFENLTMEPYLENIITTNATRRLLLFPELILVEDPAQAEAVLSGKVLFYQVGPSAYNANNIVTEYRATIKITAELRRTSDGRILWRGDMIRFYPFSADLDLKRQDDLERIAQTLLAIRLAEDLSSQLTETF